MFCGIFSECCEYFVDFGPSMYWHAFPGCWRCLPAVGSLNLSVDTHLSFVSGYRQPQLLCRVAHWFFTVAANRRQNHVFHSALLLLHMHWHLLYIRWKPKVIWCNFLAALSPFVILICCLMSLELCLNISAIVKLLLPVLNANF